MISVYRLAKICNVSLPAFRFRIKRKDENEIQAAAYFITKKPIYIRPAKKVTKETDNRIKYKIGNYGLRSVCREIGFSYITVVMYLRRNPEVDLKEYFEKRGYDISKYLKED